MNTMNVYDLIIVILAIGHIISSIYYVFEYEKRRSVKDGSKFDNISDVNKNNNKLETSETLETLRMAPLILAAAYFAFGTYTYQNLLFICCAACYFNYIKLNFNLQNRFFDGYVFIVLYLLILTRFIIANDDIYNIIFIFGILTTFIFDINIHIFYIVFIF